MEPAKSETNENGKVTAETNGKKPSDAALEFVWVQFKTWDHTANVHKKTLSSWRYRVMWLIIFGAFAGILSQQLSASVDIAGRILALISALAVGLAAYAGSEILTEDLEKSWIRARSIAEAFKKEVYLYILKAPPYHKNDASNMIFKQVEALMKAVSDLQVIASDKPVDYSDIPPIGLEIGKYIETRVKQQALEYYIPKSGLFQKYIRRGKQISFALGFGGVVLGTIASTGFATSTAVWIAFLSTSTASIASFMFSNRYQYLSVSYQATANRLLMLVARWNQLSRGDRKAQRAFVAECEAVISIENSAWMAELTQQQTDSGPATEEPVGEPSPEVYGEQSA